MLQWNVIETINALSLKKNVLGEGVNLLNQSHT